MIIPDAKTKLYLVLGNPVSHSLSPALHNAAFKAQGMNSIYLASNVRENGLNSALEGIRALSVSGANVTSPYKEAVIKYLQSISPEAERIDAVNTILNREGNLHGTTTDGEGFYRSLNEISYICDYNKTVMVVGAGGACRAAAYTLLSHGAGDVVIVNRTRQRGEALADLLTSSTAAGATSVIELEKEQIKSAMRECRLIVYSLPLDSPEFLAAVSEADFINSNHLLYDLRYHPSCTEVMKLFRDRGGRSSNGLGMLLWQAALAYELFTGRSAPVEVMKKAVGYEAI